MNVVDNSPVFEPAEGVLVVERSKEAEAFEANRFYVVPDCDAVVRSALTVKGMNNPEQVNQYVFDANQAMPNIAPLHQLRSAIEKEGANLVLALYTPCRKERYFIISKVEHGDEFRDVALMAYSAERITKHCMQEAMKIFAILDPDQFLSTAHDQFSTSRFIKDYFSGAVSHMVAEPSFGMALSLPDIKDALNISGILTHRQRRKVLDDLDKYLVENIKLFKRKATTEEEKAERRRAEAEIDLVCSNIDGEVVKRIFAIMTPSQRERALKVLDPREVAKASEMILSLEKNEVKNILSRSTDGYYRLVMKKKSQSLTVHFARRASGVLYAIYLIDRYRKPEVDTLNLRLYKEAFVGLYEKFYHNKYEGEEKFRELWQKYDKRPQIYLCLNDIRQTISSACRQMDEMASPYILETEYSHLFVEGGKISIPEELLRVIK